MNKLTIALSLICALLLGCVASRFLVPKVRAGTNPTKWEYFCDGAPISPDVQDMANKLGQVRLGNGGQRRLREQGLVLQTPTTVTTAVRI